MGRNGASPEQAARKKEVLASIGRALNEVYVAVEPLSERLSELVRKIQQPPSDSEAERPHRCM